MMDVNVAVDKLGKRFMDFSVGNITCVTIASIVVVACIRGLALLLKRPRSQRCYHHITAASGEADAYSEVVIVGGGILGSALGAALAQDGRVVTIIERDLTEPDRIVGELLQPGGYRTLTKLGLQDAVENIDAHVVHGYVVHNQGASVELSYPSDDSGNTITGRSFHHGRFVMGLRQEARRKGATLVEGRVTSLVEDKYGNVVGVNYKEKESKCDKYIQADLTVAADGCFSKFRKDFNLASVNISSQFVGAILHDCPQHKFGHAEIVLSSHGPILVYKISSNCTRILVDVQGKMPANLNHFMKEEILPQLPGVLQAPFEEAIKMEAFRSMPNSFLPASVDIKPGVLLLGDAFNMRHPLTGAGMTVALMDTLIWKDQLQSVPDLKEYSNVVSLQKRFLWKRKLSHSFVVNVLAQALYALFSAADSSLHHLRQACFSYFQLGGRAVSDPVGLLSILHPSPILLIGHFFAVALYAVYQIITAYKIYQLHYAACSAAMTFVKACRIIFPLIISEFKGIFM